MEGPLYEGGGNELTRRTGGSGGRSGLAGSVRKIFLRKDSMVYSDMISTSLSSQHLSKYQVPRDHHEASKMDFDAKLTDILLFLMGRLDIETDHAEVCRQLGVPRPLDNAIKERIYRDLLKQFFGE